MPSTFYLRPTALCDDPQSEEGEALRLAGGMVFASRFALIEREGGRLPRVGAFRYPSCAKLWRIFPPRCASNLKTFSEPIRPCSAVRAPFGSISRR